MIWSRFYRVANLLYICLGLRKALYILLESLLLKEKSSLFKMAFLISLLRQLMDLILPKIYIIVHVE